MSLGRAVASMRQGMRLTVEAMLHKEMVFTKDILTWWLFPVRLVGVVAERWTVQKFVRCVTKVRSMEQGLLRGEIPGWQSSSRWYRGAELPDEWRLPRKCGNVLRTTQHLEMKL